MSATATLIAGVMSALTGLGRVPAIFATRTEKRQCVLYQVTRYIGTPSKSTPSVANAAVAVSIRPLVAIAQGISACIR
jgi:hypothetical protein